MTPQPAIGRTHELSTTCRMFLVRHGTTTLNVENRYRGRRDIPLDAQGYEDAVGAARRLSNVGLAAVYTGPLRRTIATAQIIADEARVPDLRILHGLNNLDYGAWEGMTAEEAAMYDPEAFEHYRTSPRTAACPQGERLADAKRRMLEALELIASRHAGEAVAAVTHAVMIRLALMELSGIDGEGWRQPVRRGSVTEFRYERGSVVVVPPGDDNGTAALGATTAGAAARNGAPH
jgi:broad specificity phosphatase PhoE